MIRSLLISSTSSIILDTVRLPPSNGNVAIGTSPFIDGELVYAYQFDSGASYGGSFTVAAATSSISGQKGTILEIDGYDQVPLVGDAIGFSTSYGGDSLFYIVNTVTNVSAAVTYTDTVGLAHTYYNRATLTISPEKGQGTPDTRNITGAGSTITVRTKFSQVRLTGHDFLSVGTGNKTETNYPDVDETQIIQGNETNTFGPGKVFFVSTDQGGNFRVGQFFSVDQLTGRATLDASAFNLSGLTELRLGAIGGQVGEQLTNSPLMNSCLVILTPLAQLNSQLRDLLLAVRWVLRDGSSSRYYRTKTSWC